MSEPILVPLDGSSNAENAIPYAGKLAQMFDLPLRFLHVADEGEGVDDVSQASESFGEYAAGLVERFELSGCPFTTLFVEGAPAERILDEAERSSYVVIASHGKGGFQATFIGSVADKVVRNATTPVLVVPAVGRPAEPEFSPAVVALDGSEEAERGLAAARDIMRPLGGHLILVRSYGLPPATGMAYGYYPTQLPEVLDTAAVEYLDGVAAEDDDVVVVLSDSAGAIRGAADLHDAKLVVMTSSGKGLAGRLALGSTTDRILHSLHRPLLIIPAGDKK